MSKKLLIAVLAVSALLVAGCSTDNGPTTPNGDSSTLNDRTARSNLAAEIPGNATIDSAMMWLYVSETDSLDLSVHQITAGWEEEFLTWNGLAGNYAAAPTTTLAVADTGWLSIDITSSVAGWFDGSVENYGLLLNSLDSTGWTIFNSRENAANTPRMLVYYSANGSSGVDTVFAYADAFVDSVHADSTFGDDAHLYVGFGDDTDDETENPSTRRSAIQFLLEVEAPDYSLGDFVWLDLNENGIQDSGEAGVAGVDLALYTCEGTLVANTTTDSSGHYLFDSLFAGDYRIEIDLPSNHILTAADQGDNDSLDSDFDVETLATACITLAEGASDNTWDAGLVAAEQLGSIGDFVWNDSDMDGMQDEGEAGLSGIEVTLLTCMDDTVGVDTTDEMGMYLFESLEAGDYYLTVTVPDGYELSSMEACLDSTDSDFSPVDASTACFTLEAGQVDLSRDAGLFESMGCTYSKGYWKNHAGFGPQDDVVTDLLPIWLGDENGDASLAITDAETAVGILSQKKCGHPSNGITKLYAQMLAAKLNIANGANGDDIADALDEADAFLAMYDYTAWDSCDREMRKQVLKWKDMFDAYNNGHIGPGECGDKDDYDDDDDDYGDGHGDDWGDDDWDDDDDKDGDGGH